ncbi:MAB_1171c family putative transporter [Nonomuraea sp. NPDC050643]|uniref:MAB_1171c family putative transporter n=1 Tax=Nonomuraea sp. NPDC050643 TaxID=3155660 RepID=UPI00340165EA
MADLLRQYGPPVLMWVFLLARALRTRKRRREDPTRTVWGTLLGLAVSMTVLTPVMYAAIGELTGVPNLARLLGHLSMLVAAWSSLAFMRQMRSPDQEGSGRPPAGLRLLAGFATALVVLFALAATEVNDIRWAARYAAHPFILEYWLVYLAYLGPTFGLMAATGWRYARLVGDPTIRLGLRLVGVGAVCGVTYHVHKALFFASRRLGFAYENVAAADQVLPFAAMSLVLVGASMPVWGGRAGVPGAVEWLANYRTYQGLRSLWLDLYRANPHIALVPPRPLALDLLMPYDLRMRLYRRVVEIRDGRLAMQPYMDPAVAATARAESARKGMSGPAAEVVVEAATLAAALRARAMGADPAEPEAGAPVPGGTDLDSDTTFLSEVARAYRRRRGA